MGFLYQQFVKALIVSTWKGKPKNFVFKNKNRKNLDNYLSGIKGKSFADTNFLNHYINMNVYCDEINVDLTDNELLFFYEKIKPKSSIVVEELLREEFDMFSDNAKKFQAGTADYELRSDRPNFKDLKVPGKLETL